MRISNLKKAVKLAYHANQPAMIWGKPGVGKSSIVSQVCAEEKVGFIDLRLSLLEPIDLRGLPTIEKKVTTWSRPDFLPTSGKGILFLDELVQSAPSMQAAASQLILDRRLGEYKLPAGWVPMAAGNQAQHKSATNAMPRHLANRFIHLYAEESVDDWVLWALANDIDIRVVAFIKFRPQLLCNFDPTVKGEAYASPRSWEFVSNLLGAGMNGELLLDMVQGAVGPAAASEFVGFLRVYERMPNPDAVILNPGEAEIPSDASALAALSMALVTKASETTVGAILQYFTRVAEAARPEFSVLVAREIVARTPKLQNTKAFITWAAKHNALLV